MIGMGKCLPDIQVFPSIAFAWAPDEFELYFEPFPRCSRSKVGERDSSAGKCESEKEKCADFHSWGPLLNFDSRTYTTGFVMQMSFDRTTQDERFMKDEQNVSLRTTNHDRQREEEVEELRQANASSIMNRVHYFNCFTILGQE